MASPLEICCIGCQEKRHTGYFTRSELVCDQCISDDQNYVRILRHFYYTRKQILKEVNTHGNDNADEPR